MKVLYLSNMPRGKVIERVKRGESSDNHLFGLLRMKRYGIDASYAEIEQYLPARVAWFLRIKVLGIYAVNCLLFFKFFFYDIVFHINSFGPQFLFALLHIRKPKWVLYDFGLTGMIGDGGTAKQKILRYIVGHSAGIITISEEETNRLKKLFPTLANRIQFIHHGADVNHYKPRNLQEENDILTVGFDPGRDYGTLFKATEGLGVKVVATKSHRAKLDPRTIPSYVTWRSFSDEELLNEYDRSKIFVLPLNTKGGLNDAMGCSTLMEAMSMGKAIVATRTFTMESYITNGVNGYLVAEGNVGEMRQAIQSLLKNEELRKEFGAKARKFVEENCDADKVAQRMAEYFFRIRTDKSQ